MASPNRTVLLLLGRRLNLAPLILLPLLTLAGRAQPPAAPAKPDQTVSLPAIVLPEGFQIAGRRARLVQLPDQTQWFIVFPEAFAADQTAPAPADQPLAPSPKMPATADVANPSARPIEVLPCKWLTAMTKVVNNQVDLTLEFRVWGEITTYHKRNYILPTKVATEGLFGCDAPQEHAQKPPSAALPPLRPGQKSPLAPSTEQKTDDIPIPTEMPDRLRRMLLAIPRTRPLALPADTAKQPGPDPTDTEKPTATPPTPRDESPSDLQDPSAPSSTPDDGISGQNLAGPAAYREGYAIIDRLGRLQYNPQAQTWTLLLEADDPTIQEPPLVLHPCRRLEVVEKNTLGAKEQIMFRVSGHVTTHQGQNYLLLRKLLMVYDLGNLLK